MKHEMETRLLGRQVAIEVAVEVVKSDATIGNSTYHYTGRFQEIDRTDNGDWIP